MLRAGDLTLCTGQFPSLDFRSFVALASKTGYRGVATGMRFYQKARRDGLSNDDMKAILAEHKVEIEYMDGMVHWLPTPPKASSPGQGVVFDYTSADLVEVAAAMGVRLINAVELFHAFKAEDAPEAFATVCDLAAPYGIKICLEFTPIGAVPDLRTANDVITKSGRTNGGIMLDTFHFHRGGCTLKDITAIPVARYLGLQLSDTPPEADKDLFKDAMAYRRIPGEGTANIPAILKTLRDHGVGLPYGTEVMSAEWAKVPPEDFAFATVRAVRTIAP